MDAELLSDILGIMVGAMLTNAVWAFRRSFDKALSTGKRYRRIRARYRTWRAEIQLRELCFYPLSGEFGDAIRDASSVSPDGRADGSLELARLVVKWSKLVDLFNQCSPEVQDKFRRQLIENIRLALRSIERLPDGLNLLLEWQIRPLLNELCSEQ